VKDVEELFIRPDVQNILRKITGFDIDKIFRKRPIPDLEAPKYKLLTNDQLEELQKDAELRGRALLQMPPVKKSWDSDSADTNRILETNDEIADFDESDCRYVFTDITYGLPHRHRAVVVRERDGVLRHADNKERDRILHTYFPRQGKMYLMPKMFEEEMLEKVLGEFRYEYTLDRSCNQFEPDDPDYIRVTHRTYEHICSHRRFDDLRSTRHFGPMSFYLTYYKKIDSLLIDMIQRDLLSDAEQLVQLFHIVHPESASSISAKQQKPKDAQKLILLYAKHNATQSEVIELALQSYNEAHEKRNSATVA
jgi:small subunit ribosomal protein S22